MDSIPLHRAWQRGCWLSSKGRHNKGASGEGHQLPWGEDHPQGQATQQVEDKHPRYNKADPYYLLTGREQVTVFRLRTGHNGLNYHLYSKLHIGHTEQCPFSTGSQTTEHLLQSCPIYEPLRKGIWPDHTPVARKLYGSPRCLRCTATFIEEIGVYIWWTRRRRINNP